ncbi:MAG: tripartite tricarboxylate transporter substrate-binding protein [Burkholderiales bacterium]
MKTPALLAASLLLGVSALPALADGAFPDRPITIVVPYPPGGTSDNQVRMIQEPLAKALGQAIIVENKPGASGAIAAAYVARAKPDGYTLVYPNNGLLITPLLNKQAGYDPLKAFAPVSVVSNVPMVLVVNKAGVPATNLAEFIKFAKSRSEPVLYASAGTASYGHLATTLLALKTGIKAEHIPYKGEANTTLAVRSGQVQMLLTTPSAAMLEQVNQGHLTLLGVASAKPSPVVPGARPLNETVPGYVAEVWFGLLAPAGTPPAVVNKLNAAVQTALRDQSVRTRFWATGAVPQGSTPAEFSQILATEYKQWTGVIAKTDIKVE